MQDIDVETLMHEIRQWNPQDPVISAAPVAALETDPQPDSQTDPEASPSGQGIGLLPVNSPAHSLSPDRTHSHAAASTSSSSSKVLLAIFAIGIKDRLVTAMRVARVHLQSTEQGTACRTISVRLALLTQPCYLVAGYYVQLKMQSVCVLYVNGMPEHLHLAA